MYSTQIIKYKPGIEKNSSDISIIWKYIYFYLSISRLSDFLIEFGEKVRQCFLEWKKDFDPAFKQNFTYRK